MGVGMKDDTEAAKPAAANTDDSTRLSRDRTAPYRWYGRFRVYDGSGKKSAYVPPPTNWDGYGGEAA
jgi:hypothetical protein